jgi:molybdate transport system substrate-binding protein
VHTRVVGLWFTLLTLLVLAAACGASQTAPEAQTSPKQTGENTVSGEVVAFAAASLTDAFEALAMAFSEANPAVKVTSNFAGSQQLAGQITQGAPASVFASANQTQMDVVADAGLIAGQPQVFASNRLTIAVEPGNPLGIKGLADLARPDITLVMAAEEVPAGQYARQALDAAGVQVAPASLETDVRAVLSKVALGEADAGIVYRSDVVAADGDVDAVEIPAAQNVPAAYPIAVLADAPNLAAARAFVDFVTSKQGQHILAEHGFAAP